MTSLAEGILGEIELGDRRLNERLAVLVETLAARPGDPIPQACERWAPTMAAYRLFNNDAVEPAAIVESMAQATVARCRGESLVLAVQDTTSLNYTTHVKTAGLGPLENPELRGLFVHTTLVVSIKGTPLGVIDQRSWARDPQDVGSRHRRKDVPIEAKESAKWLRALRHTEERLGPQVHVVTVADREADVYELFALAHELKGDWLIRARHDRKLQGEKGRLLETVERTPVCACTTVELPRTDERPSRRARLEVRSAEVVLVPPERRVGLIQEWWSEHPQVEHLAPMKLRSIRVGVILVTEVNPPVGEKPVRWLLLTSLPVAPPEQALACVGYYRLRWLVERYHFVLKSGCRVERMQLETVERLRRALTVYAGVAWQLLWLTYEARGHPEASCATVLDEDAWQILYARNHRTALLPVAPPDLRTIVREIAKLGGFLGRKHDGEPGVETIWRGLRRLDDILTVYRLLKEHPDLLSKGHTLIPKESSCV